MFNAAAAKKEKKLKNKQEGEEDGETQEAEGEEQQDGVIDVDEKEKLLAGVREYAISMSSDIKDLLKNEWAGSINSLQNDKKKAESERKENLSKAQNDSK